jgi:membrane-bound serine protease (ClpP class)
MTRPLLARLLFAGCILQTIFLAGAERSAHAQGEPAKLPTVPGQFFTVTEPITTESIAQIKSATRTLVDRNASNGHEPVLIFEILPGDSAPGASSFGASMELAEFISTRLGEAKHRVAYVPKPLKGYAALVALACDEVVMGREASLGPIALDPPVDAARKAFTSTLAKREGHDPDLYLGMLEPERDLRAVRTADRQLHFEFAESLSDFKKTAQVVEESAAWEGGQRGVLSTQRAREIGFAKWTADSRAEVAGAYRITGQASSDDPTLGQEVQAVIIDVHEPIEKASQAHLLGRHVEKLRQQRVNLLIFKIDSFGGSKAAADALADLILGIKDMKTVAYVEDRALGVSALAALACSEIVFRKDAQMGDIHQLLTGRNSRPDDVDERDVQALSSRAANIAEQKGHPQAVARAMVEPESVLIEAKDAKTGAQCFVLQSEANADPQRYLDPQTRKQAGHALTVKASEAVDFGLGQVVADLEEMKSIYGLRGKTLRVEGPNWVDSLVMTLTDPLVSWLLLFVGLFMLVLELKLPGIGLPAITSALAFLLFFWSHYLSGTADQLEIILFLVGMACMALELFVFPGVGVFGMSGVLLILTSIVMASHTFIWPTEEYEYREMGYTMIQLTAVMAAVACGAVVLGRYFPSIPFLNRLILKPEPWTGSGDEDSLAKPSAEGYDSLAYLVGETGRTTTMLRPSGKARFGDQLMDVTADGFFIEPDSLVEVIDVQGSKVIVRRMDV